MKKISLILVLLCSFVLFSTSLAYYSPGNPSGFVNDYTNTLSASEKSSLENKLKIFEQESSNEISIVVISSLQDDTIENFAVKLFEEWGIGKKGTDNGVLILVAKEDRKMRIEVGYGLEGALTDAQSFWIVDSVMKPAFQQDSFYGGLNSASDKIIAATEGEILPESKGSSSNKDGLYQFLTSMIVFAFVWITSVLGRSKSWWLGGVIGAVVGVVVGIVMGFLFFGIIAIAILTPLGLLFDFIVSKQYAKGKSKGSIPWYVGGGSGRGGGFGGFGGGMSGGGGSSGGW